MRSFTVHALFASLLVSSGGFYSALGADADPLAVALVKQQFINAKIVPDVIPSFNPIGTLNVVFSGNSSGVNDGAPLDKAAVQTQPTITVAGVNNNTAKFTVLMIDGDYVGSSSPQGLNIHWLENNVAINSAGATSNTTARLPYAGPGPAAGSGPHRYTILLYQQPSNFTAPADPAQNSGVHRISLAKYVSAAGLSEPLAGLYFTVEVGTATVSVESTTAVNTATLSYSTTTKSSGTGTSSTSKPTKSGAATRVGPTFLGGSLAGLFGIAALLA